MSSWNRSRNTSTFPLYIDQRPLIFNKVSTSSIIISQYFDSVNATSSHMIVELLRAGPGRSFLLSDLPTTCFCFHDEESPLEASNVY